MNQCTKMTIVPVLILAGLWFMHGYFKTTGPEATADRELARILKVVETPAYATEDEGETAGWCEPANRVALANFITENPGTEAANCAEVWSIFMEEHLERNPSVTEERQRRAKLAERLRVIAQTSTRPGTVKMARLQRAAVLFAEDESDHGAFQEQVAEILNHIKEYETEKDVEYRRYLRFTGVPRPEIEPNFRFLAADEEMYAHQLDRALEMTRVVKDKFPDWKRQSVDSQIEMIGLYKRGWTPENSVRMASRN
jgi:hypothetical protein